MLTAAQLTALAAEVASDPTGLSLQAFATAGSDQQIADALNATTGPGAGTVTESTLSRDEFLTSILPGVLALSESTNAALQAKWDRLLGVAQAANTVSLAAAQAILQMAVSDGLLTSQQAGTVGQRTGSRAEVLFGTGTVVGQDDVSRALRGM